VSGWVLVAAAAALAVVLVAGLALAIVRLRRSHRAPTAAGGPTPVASAPDPGPEGTRRDLRPVGPQRPGDAVSGVLPRDLAGPPGGLALLQLSSQFCADCRASRAVLTDVAGEHPGLTVREVDVAMRPELVRLLGIRRTPTTLVVDPAGVELARHVGVPRRADLLGSLAPWRRTG
jgi:thiol-disulfide isomerase/thioredoxin